MNRESNGSLLSTVFVDYDNIYLSLKRKNEEAAKRFAKNASVWISAIASGDLITPTNGMPLTTPRRIVMNRCYGNPVPRRNNSDNSTDMNSFPFVRHHYLRAGFEVIDCPPLTAQLKNSADIRMVMDVRDYLLHDTYFDEFIILSGDADFTPVLHRLRAHARRTVIYANDYTAAPYRAISDGEIRESDLISLLVEGSLNVIADGSGRTTNKGLPSPDMLTKTRSAILNEVLETVRSAPTPVPLEALADRAVRVLGHDKTVGTAWGGAGSFRDLLVGGLPKDIQLSQAAPYYVEDLNNHQQSMSPAVTAQQASEQQPQQQVTPAPVPKAALPQPQPQTSHPSLSAPIPAPVSEQEMVRNAADDQFAVPASQPLKADLSQHRHAASNEPELPPVAAQTPRNQAPTPMASQPQPQAQKSSPTQQHPTGVQDMHSQPAASPSRSPQPARSQASSTPAGDQATSIQQSISRIHEACQAPPLSPPEYKVLFEVMAQEIKTNGLTGARTLVNIVQASQELGVNLRRDDARFILEVISEADPWFEHGASANLFASRFRNFVVARCRSQGMNLSANELDLIDAWFAGTTSQDGQSNPGVNNLGRGTNATGQASLPAHSAMPVQQQQQNTSQPLITDPSVTTNQTTASMAQGTPGTGNNTPTGSFDPFGGVQQNVGTNAPTSPGAEDDEFPRIIRSRARG